MPGAIDELLARQTATGVAWYLDDHEGSVGDIIDNTGAVIDHVDYTAYGQVAAESAPAQGDRFKYAGMEYDAAIGLYNDRRRYYDPALGRFIGRDPKNFTAGDLNLYRYVGNEPISDVDPNGLQAQGGPIDWPNVKPTGDTGSLVPGGPEVTEYSIKLPNGQTVTFWKPNPKMPPNEQYQCHGLTFGGSTAPGGPFTPLGDSVPAILENYYDRVDSPAPGDIAVFYQLDPKTGEPVAKHSAILTCVVFLPNGFPDNNRTMLRSKNGNAPEGPSNLGDLRKLYGSPGFYRRKN